ncbi:hypothetical protein K440DRAFT_641890 [Wilcoxina mikolae CBS 423.85]|nr:hypothetical protein K440DRAFT_641890 [Wilcoxina mikolae CBS 423.85]
MSFGFSVSDFVVVGRLIPKLLSALSESTGSSPHYQELISTLYSYQRSVLEAEQICRLPTTQFHGATMNAIAHSVQLARAPVEVFLDKIKGCEARRCLGVWGVPGSGGGEPVRFEDALGGCLTLPLQLVQNWDVFHTILRARFQQFPGERRVQKGVYEILHGGRRLTKAIWATSVLPGMRFENAMIIKREIDRDQIYRCPRADCKELNTTPEVAASAGLNCKNCGIWIHIIKGNRVEDLDDEPEETSLTKGLSHEDDDMGTLNVSA